MKIKNVVRDANMLIVKVKNPKSKWVSKIHKKSIGELGDIYRQRTSFFPHTEVIKSAVADTGKKLDILA